MNPASHRADRNRSGLSDLLIGETDDITENHGLPKLDGELEERFLDVVPECDPGVLDISRV